MKLSNLEITFYLDGTGVYLNDCIHLDALIAWALAPFHVQSSGLDRDSAPIDIPLPLCKWHIGNVWGWKASALFPDIDANESIQYWRKKFRGNRIEYTNSNPNLQQGIYREYNVPIALTICKTMTAYAVGNRNQLEKLLNKHIKFLGKKGAYGKGKVIKIMVEEIEHDYSLVKDGLAMRYLPDENSTRFCRTRPPYWNRIDRVNVCEVGDKYNLQGVKYGIKQFN